MTVGEWIEHCTDRLRAAGLHFGHGTDCPEDEAAWLVLHAVGSTPGRGDAPFGDEVSAAEAAAIESLLRRRIEERVPLAYLTGSAFFAGLEFEIDRSVLVPRSPLAELVLEQFAPWRPPQGIRHVLDLCTGSGCIAIAVAVHLPWVRVDAADISAAALEVARRNVRRHGVGNRVALHRSDLFAALPGRRYDVIVSNPPYVPAQRVAELPPEFRAEPQLGLAAGADGLEICLRILAESARHLEDQGILVCEVGESQQRLEALLPSVPFLWLEFARGGSGVFVLEKRELVHASDVIAACREEREHV